MLLTSEIPSYDLLCINVKIPEKPLSRQIQDKYSNPIYDAFVQTLRYTLNSIDIRFCGNEEEFK